MQRRVGQLGEVVGLGERTPVKLFALAIKVLKIVVLARVGLQDVDDHAAVVEQNPPGKIGAFDRAMLFTRSLEAYM